MLAANNKALRDAHKIRETRIPLLCTCTALMFSDLVSARTAEMAAETFNVQLFS